MKKIKLNNKKCYLIINSADTNLLYLGLYLNNCLISNSIKLVPGQLSKIILKEINSLFSKNNISITDLGAIIVNQGPGSYTSLRIGIAVANTLCWSLNVPVYGCKHNQYLSVLEKIKKVKQIGFNNTIDAYYQQAI